MGVIYQILTHCEKVKTIFHMRTKTCHGKSNLPSGKLQSCLKEDVGRKKTKKKMIQKLFMKQTIPVLFTGLYYIS